jgi:secreted trypsin-like serine protease
MNDCRKRYESQQAFISEQSQLCAGGEEGRDSCSGDSGSILMTHDVLPEDHLDTWRFIGIVSFGPRTCGTKNMPGVYAKVRFYIDWILDNVRVRE